MRKLLISILLASAAASPAIAGPHNSSDRQQARADRQQAHEDRVQARDDARSDRSANQPSFSAPARQSFSPPARQSFSAPAPATQFQAPRQQAVERPQYVRPARGQPQVDMDAIRAQPDARVEQMQQRVDQRQQQTRDNRDFRQSTRQNPNVMRDRHPLVVSDTPRPGTQPPLRAESHVRWNTNWRNDHHYDWRHYRDRHRSRFHLGFYYDPFGWGYQSFNIGYRMWPAYYGNQFWIDPAMYGLPYPPPGAVWIRYFNDAMLIDTYSGTVIDVIPGFFW